MIKVLLVILCARPLLQLAPAPAARPAVYRATITIVQTAHAQACTYENAPFRAGPVRVNDAAGVPFGHFSVFSCSSMEDMQASYRDQLAQLTTAAAEKAAYTETCRATKQPVGCPWPRP